MDYYSVKWVDDHLSMLDQTLLPAEEKYLRLTDYRDVIEGMKSLRVRGAPAIGVAAAYGVVLAAMESSEPDQLSKALDEIREARPTAVNLMWAVDRMRKVTNSNPNAPQDQLIASLQGEADRIFIEDVAMCEKMGKHGNTLIVDGMTILTHCNTGALATAGIGTALAPLFVAHRQGKKIKVYADETRPLLQGARLTMWELMKEGIDATLICDSAAAFLMSRGKIDCVFVGADRIVKNGDVANKIGTLSVAAAASRYGVKFYVVAPRSTFDRETPDGSGIEIEQRDSSEITHSRQSPVAPEGANVESPAFDITPAELITAIISERGVYKPGQHDPGDI
jgi:methylthioribose-1-phosphate isomerase